MNLLGNAVKFSRPGGDVTVSIGTDDRSAVCTVADGGPGIDAELLPHVFDRFARGDPARLYDDGGSGLGLAICREIVVAHGGRIWVSSHPGEGAAFSFSLPLAETPRGPNDDRGIGLRIPSAPSSASDDPADLHSA